MDRSARAAQELAPTRGYFCRLFLFELVEENGGQYDDAKDDLLAKGLDADPVQPAAEHGDDQQTEEGATHGPGATEEAGAADDNGRDDDEFAALADGGVAGAEFRGGDEPTEDSEHRANGVDRPNDPRHADAGEAGRFFVAADGADVAPEAGPFEDDGAEDETGQHDNHGKRNDASMRVLGAEPMPVAQPIAAEGNIAGGQVGDGFALGKNVA